jgi:hypothetical protein
MFHRYLSKLKGSNVDRYGRFAAVRQQIGVLDDVENFKKAFQKAFQERIQERHLVEASHRPRTAQPKTLHT